MAIYTLPHSPFEAELTKRHTHAEIVFMDSPDEVVYREADVIELMKFARARTLVWAAEEFYGQNNVRQVALLLAKGLSAYDISIEK